MKLISIIKKQRLKINGNVFYKIFLIFAIAISVPLIIMGILSIRHSTNNIVKQVNRTTESILIEKKNLIDQRITQVDNIIGQLYSSDLMLGVLRTSTSSYAEYSFEIVDVLDLINKAVFSNKIIDSIYVYDDNHDFVLYDTKYTKSDFTDSEILNLDFEGSCCTLLREKMNGKVVSYVKKYYDYPENNEIFIVANINYKMLFDGLMPDDPEYPLETVIFDDNLSLLFLRTKTFTDIEASTLIDILSNAGESFIYRMNHQDYYFYKIHYDILSWNIVYMQTYSSIVHSADLARDLTAMLIIIVLVLGLILAYIFSRYLYKPLRKLALNVEKYMDNKSSKGGNEYQIINESMEKLFRQNTDLSSKYKTAFPYFIQYSLSRILSEGVFDADKFENILDLMGIQFSYLKYIVVLVDLENSEFLEELDESFNHFLQRHRENFIYIMSNISSTRSVIILNTDDEVKTIYSIMQELKEKINGKGIKLTISMGRPYTKMEKISLSFLEALQQIQRKFFSGRYEIILYNDFSITGKKFFYDKNLEEELINSIKSQNREKAVQYLEKFTYSLDEDACTIEYVKYVYFQLVSNIIYMVLDLGIQPEETEMTGVAIFSKIQKTETIVELKEFIHMIISKVIDLIGMLKKTQHEMIINKVIEYIMDNYNMDISLDDISSKVFMNKKYLNMIFKEEMGSPIYDYITKIRMEKAKKLILDENVTIKRIAEIVGYNNIQCFIRMFKKFYSLTPIEFRRKNC